MKLSDLPLEEKKEWDKKFKRFKRAWIKKNGNKSFLMSEVLEAFCDKYKVTI